MRIVSPVNLSILVNPDVMLTPGVLCRQPGNMTNCILIDEFAHPTIYSVPAVLCNHVKLQFGLSMSD
jgi:hypothetical protein